MIRVLGRTVLTGVTVVRVHTSGTGGNTGGSPKVVTECAKTAVSDGA